MADETTVQASEYDQYLTALYNRLQSGTAYTPLSAQTFADWSLEAGDIVTVTKDGASYQTPVMRSGLEWRGGSMVTIESTGNKDREPLNKLSKREFASYGAGGAYGGYYGNNGLWKKEGQFLHLLEDTASYHRRILIDEAEGLMNYIERTASHSYDELIDFTYSLRNVIESTASYTRQQLTDDINGLVHYIEDTASRSFEFLRDETNGLVQYIEDTASYHRRSLIDEANGLANYIEMTASYSRQTLADEVNGWTHYIENTASRSWEYLRDEVTGFVTYVERTASYSRDVITSEVYGWVNYIERTASYTRDIISSEVDGWVNYIERTASYTRDIISDEVNGWVNYIEDTASRSYRELVDTTHGLSNYIENTASRSYQSLRDDVNGLKNEIVNTASMHMQTLENTTNGLKNEIVDTASMHMQTLSDTTNGLKHEIILTASQEISRISDTTTGLQSQINQLSDKVGIVVEGTGANAHVKPASIVAAITDNNGVLSSEIKLSADEVFLDGNTTINDVMSVQSNYLYINKTMYIDDGSNLTIIGPSGISTNSINFGANYAALNVVDVQPNAAGTVLTITYADGTTKTFSKASATTKISGSWSGGIYSVVADEAGQLPPLATTSLKIVLTGNPTVSNKKVRQDAQVWYFDPDLTPYTSNPYQNTGMTNQQIEIDATSVYTAGQNSVRLKIVPHSGSAWDYNVGLDKSESGSEITEYAVWLQDEGLDTETGVRPISAMIGANTVSQTIYVHDYTQGQDSIINAGSPLNVTANTNGSVQLNRYVTTYSVNVPAPTVKVRLDRNFDNGGTIIDAVVPKTDGTGSDFLRTWVEDNGLNQSGSNPGNKTRRIRSLVGSTPIFDTTYTDYKDGWDAVAAPTFVQWENTRNLSYLKDLRMTWQTDNKSNDAVRRGTRYIRITMTGSGGIPAFDSTTHKGEARLMESVNGSSWTNIYGATIEIDASRVYEAGQAAASEPDIVYDGWTVTNVESATSAIISNQIKFKHSSGTKTGNRNVYLTQDSSFTSKKKWVWMRDNASNGTAVGKIQVDATSVYNDGYNAVGAPTFSQWQETDGTTVITPSSTAPATTATSRNVQMKWVTNDKTTGAERKATKNLYLSVEMSGSKPAFDANHVAYVRLRDYSGGYRYVARVAVDASSVYAEGAGQTVVAKPTFEFTGDIGTQNKKYTTITAKATSGSRTESTGTYVELQSGTYGSRGNHCINLYSEDAGAIIARYDIESMINGSAADANVVFQSWLNTPDEEGTNNVLTNTARFANESNSAKTAAKTIFMTYDSGFEDHKKWIKVHEDNAVGATVLRYQVDASSEWNAAIAGMTISGTSAGVSEAVDKRLYAGDKWKVIATATDASGAPVTRSYVIQVQGTGGSNVKGTWGLNAQNIPTYTVDTADSGGQSLPISTSVILKVRSGWTNAIVNAIVYHDVDNDANIASTQSMELIQDVGNRRVNLNVDGDTKAWVSTADTYNAGIGQGYSNVHHVNPDANRNRAVNGKVQYWNAILRSTNGTELRTVYADVNQGTGFVIVGRDYGPLGPGEHVINDAVGTVTVAGVDLQDKDVTVSRTTTIYPDSGYGGMSSITVRVNKGREVTLTRGAYDSYSRTYTFSVQLSDTNRTLTAYVP